MHPWMKAAAFSLLVGGNGASSSRHCSGFLFRVRQQQQLQQRQRGPADTGGLSARSSYLRFLSPWATRGAVPSRCQERGSVRRWIVQPDVSGTSLVRPRSTMVMGGVTRAVATLALRSVPPTVLPATAALRGGGRGARSSSAARSQRLSSTAAAVPAETDMADVSIIKPDRDVRSYRYLTLPNGLEVVLVNDPVTEKAAASMFIRAGHMQDPPQLAGLAHFHEHSERAGLCIILHGSSERHTRSCRLCIRDLLLCAC